MITLRTLAERLARGRSLKRTIQVGSVRVPVIVTPDAQLKYLKTGPGAFDADLIALAQSCLEPEDIVWDIGANVGVFALAASVTAKSVLAVEADIWLAGLIRRSLALPDNAGRAISVLPVALDAQDGVAAFYIAQRGRASNALASAGGRTQMGGVREVVLTPTLTLDTLLKTFPPPSVIKMDVEGAEKAVLDGGTTLLRDHDPLLYIEIGKELNEAVASLLLGMGYALFDEAGTAISISAMRGANYFFAKPTQTHRLDQWRKQQGRA
ncbi:MAG: FkbM family methyltransferase [Rhodospirillaceae bacterium]